MNGEEFKEIEKIKQKGGMLWFIERKDNGQWFYFTFEEKDNLPCTCHKCYPSGYPFKTSKDGWTNNPQQADGFLTKEDAEKGIFFYYTDEPEENLIITEHVFI